ncbi:uncharacterized protein OCT59_020947 [Rhizophagus irregularis]|uniref:uncharacterized protein n=1 Tax=Rhizophagus irregularis TaxID=588596 RepID=UPI0019E2872E|nr:hypothetical protein OCT59_020947 [Rhizophagus irregularis]GET60311.1 hypothetical protein GLOIN_2v1586536 [Rhizophagus irregularis DAOM 181602=DAOM 197198]
MNFDLCQDCKPKSYVHDHPNDHAFQPITYSHLFPDLYSILSIKKAICDYYKLNYSGSKCYKCANGEFSVEEYEIFQITNTKISL